MGIGMVSILLSLLTNFPFPFGNNNNNDKGKVCSYTGWNYYYQQQTSCSNGTIEMFRDVDNLGWMNKFCCNPKHRRFKEYVDFANTCRVTSCELLSSSSSSSSSDDDDTNNYSIDNLCSTFDARYINKGKVQLEYEEIFREPCRNKNGTEGNIAVCCVKNSTEALLNTVLRAELAEFPHQVALRFPDGSLCGGTIYNKRYVVTASHCIVDEKTRKTVRTRGMKVVIGSNIADQKGSDYVYTVEKLIPHPKYSKLRPNPVDERWFNDIALVKVTCDIQFGPKVKALQIAPKGFAPNRYSGMATVVGYGTTDNLELPEYLQKANFLLRSDRSCFLNKTNSPHPEMEGLQKQLLCLGGIFEGSWSPTAGGGDSGGPAICRDSKGKAVLCGVCSFGGDDKDCRKYQNEDHCSPSVFSEVSYFHDWIKKVAGEQDPSTLYRPFLYGEPVQMEKKVLHQVYISSDEGKSCGGSLISPDIVISAAHCVTKKSSTSKNGTVVVKPLENLLITVGTVDLNKQGKFYKVKSFEVLPDFAIDDQHFKDSKRRVIMADKLYKNDLAVIKLEKATDIIEFPELPEPGDIFEGADTVATELAFPRDTKYSSMLTQRDFRILYKKECQERMNRMSKAGMNITVHEDLKCFVERYSGGSICDRELGGGVFCKKGGGKEALCGVQVFRLCEFSIPNYFIDVGLHVEWIRGAIGRLYDNDE